jgi:hypothetical protein
MATTTQTGPRSVVPSPCRLVATGRRGRARHGTESMTLPPRDQTRTPARRSGLASPYALRPEDPDVGVVKHAHTRRMNLDSEQRISAKLAQIEADISMLREGYLVVNKRYADTLQTMKALTEHSLEASLRSATAAEKAALACRNATAAAVSSASENIITATQAAAEAAALAAVAASEAAAAASAAAAAAATAAAVQAEETSLQASAEAARATARATAAAAEAARMATEASAVARALMQARRT